MTDTETSDWWQILEPGPTRVPHMLHEHVEPGPSEVQRFSDERRAIIAKALRVKDPAPFIERLEWGITRVRRYVDATGENDISRDDRNRLARTTRAAFALRDRWEDLPRPVSRWLVNAWVCANPRPSAIGPFEAELRISDYPFHRRYLNQLCNALKELEGIAQHAGRRRGRKVDPFAVVAVQCCVEVFVRARRTLPRVRKHPSGERTGPIVDLVLAATLESHPALIESEIQRRKAMGGLGI